MPALTSPKYSDDRTRLERKRLRGADVLIRAATVELLRQPQPLKLGGSLEPVRDVLERHYGADPATEFYIRSAVSPANTTTVSWAAELVGTAVADFLAGPQGTSSAFAQLAAKATSVTLPPGVGVLKIPSRLTPETLVGGWVGESGAKPISLTPFAATGLSAYKLAVLTVFSEEMLTYGTANLEAIVSGILRADLVAKLDTALLDASAASSVRPAGLFNSAVAVTASAATPATSAMVADLKALTAAVIAGNPDASITFIVNPAQQISIRTFALQPLDNMIVSNFMPAGSVGAVDTSAIAMTATAPVFAQSRSAALHSDSVPLPLATGAQGSAVVASPMRSTFQEDTIALRSVLRAGWIKCRAAASAIVSGATW